jgi:hypothetical protein
MSSVLEALGIDPEELQWTDLAVCNLMDTNLFFDDYEADENVAKMIDEACLSCPVMAQCLAQGMDNGEWGVWGGIYLTSGKPDQKKNAHKTPEVWDEIRSRIVE